METVTSRDGTTIAFDRYGSGPAVVLVGGAIQHRRIDQQTARLGQLLADAGLAALHYDRRGRGDSTDTQPYAIERELEDLDALIDAAGGSAFLYGMSSGAALVLHAAATGRPTDRIALYEAPFDAGDGPTDPIFEAIREGRNGDAMELFMRNAGMPAAMVAQARQSPGWPAREAVAPTLAYDLTIMGDGSPPTDVLAAIKAPVLAMDGGASPPWAAASAEAIVAGVANGRRRTLADQTHAVDPEVLAPVLIEFFS
jgi:pimeloyl-ACP methyl ester carboxylesterase